MSNLALQTAAPPTTLTKPDVERLRHALAAWTAAEPLPAKLAPMIPDALSMANSALSPIDGKAVAGTLQRLWDGLAWCPPSETIEQWKRILSGYPEDLIKRAVDQVLRTHRWAEPPKLADVVRWIDEAIADRRAWKRKLETAAMRARMDAKSNVSTGAHEPMTPKTEAMIAEAKRALADAAKPMPKVQGDSSREQPRREVGGGRPMSAVMRELAARPKADRPWATETRNNPIQPDHGTTIAADPAGR